MAVRNELRVTIPSYFKCPISMEIMKSPVSLTTGVTYDRSSIQSWLESGHTTCPATMQPLSSPSFVPNLTLLRLMNLWPTLSSPPSPRTDFLASFRKLLSQAKTSDEYCRVLAKSHELSQSIKKACEQVKNSEDFCRVLGNSKDILDTILRLILMFEVVYGKVENLELMLILLDMVVNDVGVYKNLINQLPKLVFVLRNGNTESKVATARILQKIVNIDGEARLVIMETPNLLQELYNNLVKCGDNTCIEAGFSLLIAVANNTRSIKKDILKLGMVNRVGEILYDERTHNTSTQDTNVVVIERLIEALEMMAMCSEGRKAICEDERCVDEIVRRLMKVSRKATEHGVTVLWSVCYKFQDEKVVDLVRRCNGVGKCLLLLQSDCTPLVKQMCGGLIRVLRASSKKACLVSYETKTTHVMPC